MTIRIKGPGSTAYFQYKFVPYKKVQSGIVSYYADKGLIVLKFSDGREPHYMLTDYTV